MKVTYRDRVYLDKYRCIDHILTKQFDKSWVCGGLTYFKKGEFNIFVVDTSCIIKTEK